jgi:hypothetical protein
MRTNRGIMHAALPVLIYCSIIFSGCGSAEILSHKLDHRIEIDGDNRDWERIPSYVIERQNISIAITNDRTDLYLCLTSADRSVRRQFFAIGFTVWIDPDGGSSKTLGIRFPLRMEPGEMHDQRGDPPADQFPDQPDQPEGRFEPRHDRSMTIPERSLTEMEILGPERDQIMRVSTLQEKEILVKARDSHESLVYELRVPLKRIFAMAHNSSETGTRVVGIGLESSEVPSERSRPEGDRSGPPPGRGGMSRSERGSDEGVSPQSGQGHPRGGRQQREEATQIKAWIRSPLAD